jgi:hypothetical protein
MLQVGFEHTIPVGRWQKTYRSATVFNHSMNKSIKPLFPFFLHWRLTVKNAS